MRREHTLTLDGTDYTLRFSLRAFRLLRDEYGHAHDAWEQDPNPVQQDIVQLADWFHAGLVGGGHTLTRDDVDDLVDLDNYLEVFEAVLTALGYGAETDAELDANPPEVATATAPEVASIGAD